MITYKYKLYRTKQTKHIDAMLRETCWIWNHALALHKRYYKIYHKHIDVTRLKKKWPKWYGISDRIGAQTMQEVLDRLEISWQLFFKRIQRRPPKFKKAEKFTTFVFTQWGYSLNGNVFTIHKINKRFKFSLSRPYEGVGKIKRVSVCRTPAGDYYIILFIDNEVKPIGKTHNGASVGIDFGLRTYMTLSDGKRIQSPLFLKHAMREKKRRDRRMSRCKEGSNHHHQATTAKARLEERITNKRDDWQWKIAHQLCREYDNICIEDLELEGMKKLWGRKMEDLAHGNFVKKLEYLACRYGVNVLKVDRFFPSSRLCECGHIYKHLTLNDREWVCPVCGRHHDRDLHAANNILRQGIASLGSPRKTRKSTSVVSALGRKHPRIPRQ